METQNNHLSQNILLITPEQLQTQFNEMNSEQIQALTVAVSDQFDPLWKEKLVADPLMFFFPYSKLLQPPFSAAGRTEQSEVVTYAQWISTIEGDACFACLCTDTAGMVKRGFWTTYNDLISNLPLYSLGSKIGYDADAVVKLKEIREALFGLFFEPDDVSFILKTIPCTTTLAK